MLDNLINDSNISNCKCLTDNFNTEFILNGKPDNRFFKLLRTGGTY